MGGTIGVWGFDFQPGLGIFLFSIQTGSGAHPASYPLGTGDSFPGGVKLTTCLLLVPRSRMCGAIPPAPQYVFMAWCLVMHRDVVRILNIYNCAIWEQ